MSSNKIIFKKIKFKKIKILIQFSPVIYLKLREREGEKKKAITKYTISPPRQKKKKL